jgi:hypothetical protein
MEERAACASLQQGLSLRVQGQSEDIGELTSFSCLQAQLSIIGKGSKGGEVLIP